MDRRGSRRTARTRARDIVATLVLPIAATAIGTSLDLGPFGPPSLYLLAVVATAAIGGLWSGLAAAALSFVGLNYFFTPPLHTLRVGKPEDLVALFVFVGTAAIVGALLARALAERQRVERREDELRLVNRFSTRLLSSDLTEQVVRDVAGTLVGLMDLRSCEIDVPSEPSLSASASSALAPIPGEGPAPEIEVAIAVGPEAIGALRAKRSSGAFPFAESDERLLQAIAGQLGLAMQRRQADSEARAARTGAEISEIRAALFSSVTHDLRTPLASIKAGITGLMDESVPLDPKERRELFTTVLEETERLNRLVDNILNLARARAGDIAIERELTPFEDVVETVLSRLRGTLAPFSVRTTIRDELPGVWVDPVKMDQALTNIIENAARHSPPGSEIHVAVSPLRDGIQIRVADQGPGIPEDERETVFEPFFRGRASAGTGSGLGLAIARAVVQAHGGAIKIEGAPGGGTAVVIELPAGAPSEHPAVEEEVRWPAS
ncbi:MAG TPA: ATP-binding protein [Actinomycetota bacterium]|jgi:two-component system sensor histidine kinase KdpD|nr:ATP-binding protein [Actinomycetota bacterium]